MSDDRDPAEHARRRDEGGYTLVIAMALVALLLMLGTTMLAFSTLESQISRHDLWSEGAFHAAESGVHAALEQLRPDPTQSVQPIASTPITAGYDYRSGSRHASAPEPLAFLGTQREPGFGIGIGTGYNPSGYAFARYRVNATGLGPRSVRRELEALVQYGPLAE